MAAGTLILKEFLVAVGFDVKDDEFEQSTRQIDRFEENITKIGVSVAAVGVLVDKYVTQMATKFEDMYYSAKLAGSSVDGMQALEYGAQQVGVKAGVASASLAALGRALRLNPGNVAFLNQLGISTKDRDNAQVMIDLVTKLKTVASRGPAGEAVSYQIAKQFGIDPDTLKLMEDGLAKLKAAEEERKNLYASAGINPEQAGQNAVEFNNNLRRLTAEIDVVKTLLMIRFMPAVEFLANALEKVINVVAKADKLTGGKSTLGLGIAGTAGAIYGGNKIVGALFRFLRGGPAVGTAARAAGAGEALGIGAGAAEGAGVAAAGGAAAEGLGGAGAVAAGAAGAPIAAIVAAVVAALAAIGIGYEIYKHWDKLKPLAKDYIQGQKDDLGAIGKQIGEAAKSAGEKIAEVPGKLADAISPNAHRAVQSTERGLDNLSNKLAESAKAAGQTVMSTASKVQAEFTKGWEGFRRTVYKDIGGIDTVGRGHRVLAGERFDKPLTDQQGNALFDKDNAAARAAVLRQTKGVNLSKGQLDALTDFQFNIGHLGDTLLKDIKAGNLDKAASDFELYNKARVNGKLTPNAQLTKRRLGEEAMFRAGTPSSTITQKTDIHVNGAGDPKKVADNVANEQRRVNADLVRHSGAPS